jgi:hypothetical protein
MTPARFVLRIADWAMANASILCTCGSQMKELNTRQIRFDILLLALLLPSLALFLNLSVRYTAYLKSVAHVISPENPTEWQESSNTFLEPTFAGIHTP